IFQIAPGTTGESLWLSQIAAEAARDWAILAAERNDKTPRKDLGSGKRSTDGRTLPAMAKHLAPTGEVRLHDNPKSTLYNTDGQIFSDAGLPVVLFMENYDINREGYHDTHDTMANIDLDYGAAVAAIAIETVARAAAGWERPAGPSTIHRSIF
ncbi:MAG TPA: M28 family peptidase, partial [Micropepsaceae bacterium]|nr:M28 family peptidase [Micropepsaceae bacterium]